MSVQSAVRRYVRGGFREGFMLNPLFSEQLVSMQLSDAGRVPALYAYLVNDRRRIRTSLLWDAPTYAEAHPDSLSDPAGPLGHAWRSLQAGASVDFGFGDGRAAARSLELASFVRHALKAPRRSASPTTLAPLANASAVVIWRVSGNERDVALTLQTAVEVSTRLGAALVLSIQGARPDAWMPAMALVDSIDAVVLADHHGEIARGEASRVMTAGSRLIVRGPGDEITADGALALASSSGVTAPLVLDADGVIVNCGLMRRGGRLQPFLHGHPAEDARRIGVDIQVDAIASTTFAQTIAATGRPRTAHVHTGSWVIVDGSARTEAPIVIDAESEAPEGVEELAARIGLAPVNDTSASLQRLVSTFRAETPRLRWALKTAAPAGLGAEWWGDTHFARGLADALRRLGQDVVIDSIGARDRPSRHLDDVELVLRGPERIDPRPAATSLLWIISHPDQVTRDEVSGFDRVFAASGAWASSVRDTVGDIEPLLQCTDVHRFHPAGVRRTDRIVFVGTARGIPRPSVIEPIRAGIEVDVYGPDWTGWIPASSVVSAGIANSALPALYEGARLVLNDHWPAMQQRGFISNRLFDVVAAGGRAVSDDVAGIDELFGGMVRTYRSIPELVEMIGLPEEDLFPHHAEAKAIGDRIRADHSFDSRASTLLRAALHVRSQR
ncbi:MAG: glycosyltransferase [Microbacterium arborescens]